MPPKGAPTQLKPIRLQSISALRVKRPDKQQTNPCQGAMSVMLSCWASSGLGTTTCMAAEQSLRNCMDAPKPPKTNKSTVNYHLARLYPKISGPQRRKGSLG
ncbi:hypothetical protein GJ744_003157 [Endocarpon pusillum]|uniref:Small ribosomal subunit protein mS37 n=1 Tax=Endocarpon pusillum TaxID=364733 RepID=A0A8H7AQY5_9EURO|nr:hypothetical protein GJ744_003157 [Endocarpon pusillum]